MTTVELRVLFLVGLLAVAILTTAGAMAAVAIGRLLVRRWPRRVAAGVTPREYGVTGGR